MTLEILSNEGVSAPHRPALLFIHGGFHGAWCWREHMLPWFAAQGWQAHALSLRGHASNDDREAELRCTLSDYASDVSSVLDGLKRPAVLVGHSMGGVVAQMCLKARADVAGAVFMAPSPLRPSASVIWRIFMHDPVTFIRAQILGDMKAMRHAMAEFFFDDDLDPQTQARYVSMLTAETLTGELFSRAPPSHPPGDQRPILIVAGREDWSIPMRDHEALRDAYRATLSVCPGGHDLMLSRHWEETAKTMRRWLESKFDAAGV